GKPEFADRPEFSTVDARNRNVDSLEEIVRAWTRAQSVDNIATRLEENGVPYAQVADVGEVVRSEQIIARDMMIEVDHPTIGPLNLIGNPIKFRDGPKMAVKAPPLVGEDNRFVYSDVLGYSIAEIERLREDGVI